GKSTLLAHAILADAKAGRSAVIIDPRGDLIYDLLARLPETATRRVWLIDPDTPPPPAPHPLSRPAANLGRGHRLGPPPHIPPAPAPSPRFPPSRGAPPPLTPPPPPSAPPKTPPARPGPIPPGGGRGGRPGPPPPAASAVREAMTSSPDFGAGTRACPPKRGR